MAEQGGFGALDMHAPEAALLVGGVDEHAVPDEGAELPRAHAELVCCVLEVEPGTGGNVLAHVVFGRGRRTWLRGPATLMLQLEQTGAAGDLVDADGQFVRDRDPAAGCAAESQAGRSAAREGAGIDVVDCHGALG